MPLTPAEKQAAYRERLRAKELLVDPLLPARDVEDVAVSPQTRTPTVTLEQYVQQIRNEALAYSKSIGETNDPWPVPGTREFIQNRRSDRLARAEKYARWRFAGFLDGTVASL